MNAFKNIMFIISLALGLGGVILVAAIGILMEAIL